MRLSCQRDHYGLDACLLHPVTTGRTVHTNNTNQISDLLCFRRLVRQLFRHLEIAQLRSLSGLQHGSRLHTPVGAETIRAFALRFHGHCWAESCSCICIHFINIIS